jgi:major membrane immunogen (membrane-anchored lipoprotein)
MKKVFFAFVAASVVVLTACNSKETTTETTTTETTETTTETAVEEVAPADSTAVVDTTAAAQ